MFGKFCEALLVEPHTPQGENDKKNCEIL